MEDEDEDEDENEDKDKIPTKASQKAPSHATQTSTVGRSTVTKTEMTAQSNFALLTPGPSGASKRKRDAFKDDKFSDIGSNEERQLAAMADRSVEKLLKQRVHDTSGGNRLTSSQQPVARTLFPTTESAKRQKTVSFEEPRMAPTPSKVTTNPESTQSTTTTTLSSTSLSNDSTGSLSTSHRADDDDDITERVMGLLRGQRVEDSILTSVRQLLVTSVRKTKGIALGRDSARAVVHEKNIKIARLQERIVAMEDKERYLNSQITNMKAGLMKVYHDT